MGLFGIGTKEEVKEEAKTCPNCGKKLEEGKTYWKEGDHFCCEKCCDAGQRKEEKQKQGKPLTCEFC